MTANKNFTHALSHVFYMLLILFLIGETILHYNEENTISTLIIGWIIVFLGIIGFIASTQERKKQIMKQDETEKKVVDTGIYAYVRHPEYLSHMTMILGFMLISQYWITILIGFLLIALLFVGMLEEEKRNLVIFNGTYRTCIQHVPRINFLGGVIRHRRMAKKPKENVKE